MSLSSIQGTLTNVRAQADDAQSLIDAGDRETNDKSAIDDYRRAASRADTVATLCQNVTGIVVQEVPSAAGYDAAVASEVDAASSSDSDAGHATTRSAARAAAVAGVAAARSAIGYATAAAARVPSTPRVTVGWLAVAIVVAAAGAFVFAKTRPTRTVSRFA